MVIWGSKEFQDMGVESWTVVEPGVRPTCFKERREGEAIGSEGLVGEHAVID